MTMANTLKVRVQIQVRTAVLTSMGETVTWKPVANRYALRVPLSVEARAVYQQMNSVVTDKFVFSKGAVNLTLGNNRIVYGSKTYDPVEPPQTIGNSIVVVVKEV